MRLTRRFIVSSLDNIPLSNPIRYERYYINDKLRIQKKDNYYEKETLDEQNVLLEKIVITEETVKCGAEPKIIRSSRKPEVESASWFKQGCAYFYAQPSSFEVNYG